MCTLWVASVLGKGFAQKINMPPLDYLLVHGDTYSAETSRCNKSHSPPLTCCFEAPSSYNNAPNIGLLSYGDTQRSPKLQHFLYISLCHKLTRSSTYTLYHQTKFKLCSTKFQSFTHSILRQRICSHTPQVS